MHNAKNQPVIYTEVNYAGNGERNEKKWDAWLEGVQGDGSAMIYINGNPLRVPARRLTRPDGSPLIE